MRRAVRALGLSALAAACLGWPAAAPAAQKPPVVVMVFDEFPVDVLLTPAGRIDARRYPGFAALARHSTWFPNASSVYDSTEQAVPAILTGQMPREGLDETYLTRPRSLFTVLSRAGWRVRSREETTTVCPPRICPRVDRYGSAHYNILYRRRERLGATLRSLGRGGKPTFTFHHSVLPHVPLSYLPSGRTRAGFRDGALPEFGVPAGFSDPFLTDHLHQRHLLQVGFVDHAISRLLAQLKRGRMLRRALIVVTADHGTSFAVGVSDRRAATERNVHEIAPVPLFVKRPGQRGGAVNRAYARTVDVMPTVTSLLRIRLRPRPDGASAFGAEVAARTGVSMVRRSLADTIDVPGAELRRRRAALRTADARRFGTGRWRGVFRIGPHLELLGRRAASLRSVKASARATLVAPRGLRRVNPRAASVPTLAAGRILGGTGGRRDLALAVNGRVRAMGRSHFMAGDGQEYFSLTFPESALRKGRNSAVLYEVRPGPALAPLGRAPR